MKFIELINSLSSLLCKNNGVCYTSRSMQDNPDVCYACCLWFLHHVTLTNITRTLQDLESMDKRSLKIVQKNVSSAPSRLHSLAQKISSSGVPGPPVISALEHIYNYYNEPRPNEYIHNDVITFVGNIVVAFTKSVSDSMMIFMLPGGNGSGHVICLRRYIGGILIYDPNIGVMSVRLADRETWAEVLRRILSWYRDNMKFRRFGYKFKPNELFS